MGRRSTAWVACLVASVSALAGAKLDDGLTDHPTRKYPVFVRMAGQLFRRGGEYEAFCKQHRSEKRSTLRQTVLKTLRQKADTSWQHVAATVEELTRDGQVSEVERFWIVNGFACEATWAACRRLAELDAVAFIYLQRGPIRQHKKLSARLPAARREQLVEHQRTIYRQVIEQWKDDSDEPFSAEGLEIPWNLKRIQADQAWEAGATGKGSVVALCDTGLMVAPALVRALWRNAKEELNGKDDDGNGYVDDVFGYDFAARSFYALGDNARMPHGSMCGGIAAGRPINDRKLITGVAPRARLMVLRGMGYLKAYQYALANGADVLSMSYMWVRVPLGHYRGLYRTAHEHLAAGGIVAVGGAGNFSRLPKGQQIALPKDIPCVIAAAGILQNGAKAAMGSEGPCTWDGVRFYDDYPPAAPLAKPDVTGCFGGYPVWGRPLAFGRFRIVTKVEDRFALIVGPQGNSFSGPHAAGVAALMLSVNPELNVWEVKELMETTCKDIGAKGRDTVFGAGLLQALDAVRAARAVAK